MNVLGFVVVISNPRHTVDWNSNFLFAFMQTVLPQLRTRLNVLFLFSPLVLCDEWVWIMFIFVNFIFIIIWAWWYIFAESFELAYHTILLGFSKVARLSIILHHFLLFLCLFKRMRRNWLLNFIIICNQRI